VYSRLAGYEDLNDAQRLSQDPTFRLIGSGKNWDRGAALTSRLQTFETEMLAEEENFAGLGRLNRALVGKAEIMDSGYRTVLDMDSTEITWLPDGALAHPLGNSRTFLRIFTSLGSTSPTKALNSLSKWTAPNSQCSPKKPMNTASHPASSERFPRCRCVSTPDIQGFSCSRPGIEASAALE
jgi:hypothetical protein